MNKNRKRKKKWLKKRKMKRLRNNLKKMIKRKRIQLLIIIFGMDQKIAMKRLSK